MTKVLGLGDTIVRNGTRHRWLDPLDEPCAWVVAMMTCVEHDAV